MKAINQFFAATANVSTLLLAITITCLPLAKAKAGGNGRGVQAIGGTVSYTLHIGHDIITKDTRLSDDSYIFLGTESDIVIADPGGKFHIGIVNSGDIKPGKIFQATSSAGDAYTLSNYLVYDAQGKTMEAIPFDNGHVTVAITDSGSYKVDFIYTLKERKSGKLITLKGQAMFAAPQLALH